MPGIPRLNRTKIVLFFVIVGAIISALVYFFAWRPTDTDLVNASNQLKSLTASTKSLTVEIASIQTPALISAATPLKLEVLVENYKASLVAFKENITSSRDPRVSSIFNRHVTKFEQFELSSTQLLASVKQYLSVANTCKVYVDAITKDPSSQHADQLAACRTSLSKADNSPHEAFKSQFFTAYLNASSAYVSALDRKESTTEHLAKISNLMTQKFSLDTTSPVLPLRELSDSVTSQSKAFFR